MPPWASSKRPSRRATAPVKAPFTWPKSSLSSSSSGMAPQLTATNGRSARRLLQWIARATSSLPVPLSPVIEHRAVGVGDALDDVEHAAQRLARADQVLVVVAAVELALQQLVLGLEAPVLDGLGREAPEHVVVRRLDRLLEEPVGAGPQRLERRLGAA